MRACAPRRPDRSPRRSRGGEGGARPAKWRWSKRALFPFREDGSAGATRPRTDASRRRLLEARMEPPTRAEESRRVLGVPQQAGLASTPLRTRLQTLPQSPCVATEPSGSSPPFGAPKLRLSGVRLLRHLAPHPTLGW